MRFFCAACVFGILVAAASFFVDFRNASTDAIPAQPQNAAFIAEEASLPPLLTPDAFEEPETDTPDAVVAEVVSITSTTN